MKPTSTTVGSSHLRKVIMAKASFSSGKLPMVASSSRWRSLIVPAGEQVTVSRNRKYYLKYYLKLPVTNMGTNRIMLEMQLMEREVSISIKASFHRFS